MIQEGKSEIRMLLEVKKEKSGGYPYYLVGTTLSQNNYHYLFIVEYLSDRALISVQPFNPEMSKLLVQSISLDYIMSGKIISTVNILEFTVKTNSQSITIVNAKILLGYRSGQLIVVDYKDKESKIILKLNRDNINKESFFSKATSYFSSEEAYKTWFKGAIKYVALNNSDFTFAYSYQLNNTIILHRQLNQKAENKLQAIHQEINWEDLFSENKGKTIRHSQYQYQVNQHYKIMVEINKNIMMLQFNDEICSYAYIKGEGKQNQLLCISFSSEAKIMMLSLKDRQIIMLIQTEIPIRRTTTFLRNQELYLGIMPYENELILVNLKSMKYVKYNGHRSFIANTLYHNNQNNSDTLITCGMDHRISLTCIAKLKSTDWNQAQQSQDKKTWKIQDNVQSVKFSEIYSLGEYDQSRNNLYNYGFGESMLLGKCFCFFSYDHKVKIYQVII